MKTLIIAMALFGASFSQAQTTATTQIDKIKAGFETCAENARSTYDSNECASKSYKLADAELNRVYKTITTNLKKSNTPDDTEMLNRLVKSERAWVPFRDANCSLEGIQMLGGSGEGPVVGGCLVSITVSRVQSLQELFLVSK